ncbi:MAG: dihydrodipicolinate synthase family protein [Chloroflexi bacterium]|nr:MAG: dihydrodipicolinate synthase family protein [Chloroflexota bacterium]
MPRHPFLHGTYTIAPTPFLPTGELDRASLGTMVDMLVGLGVQGITMLGVMGEVDKLGDAERDVIIDDVITAAAGRVKICIGTSHVATDRCVALSKRAAELGADALMVAPPRLAKPNDAALRSHYQRVAAAVDIPVVVQDHPISSGVLMSVDFLANLARDVPGCNYLKLEEEPTPAKTTRMRAAAPDMVIFGGMGANMLLEELRHGADGCMTGFGFSEILVAICNQWAAGDVDGATQTFYQACPLIRYENQPGINLAIRKYIYMQRGAIAHAHVRAPSSPLPADVIADLHDIVTRLGLIQHFKGAHA